MARRCVNAWLIRSCKLPGAALRLISPMLVLGMMSGTSADGIDAALVRISGAPPSIAASLEGHHHAAFPSGVRQAILRLANGGATTTAEISQLNFLLGEEFAGAAIQACKHWRLPVPKLSLI